MSSHESAKTKVSSTIKALKILDCFTITKPELSLADISLMLQIPKSTALNQIRSLESEGYLYKVKNTQNYRLGYKIMELNYVEHSSMPIVKCAMPVMEALQKHCGENIYLTTHVNGKILYLECLYRQKKTVSYSVAGKTLPMHCTSAGKAMLSYMDAEQIESILETHGMPAFTKNTCTSKDELLSKLEIYRKQGYATDDEEESLGVRCVAAAIKSSSGEVAGALSISGSVLSMNDDAVETYSKMLLNAVKELEPYAQLFPSMQLY